MSIISFTTPERRTVQYRVQKFPLIIRSAEVNRPFLLRRTLYIGPAGSGEREEHVSCHVRGEIECT